jgi:hypothetical protein
MGLFRDNDLPEFRFALAGADRTIEAPKRVEAPHVEEDGWSIARGKRLTTLCPTIKGHFP